ncbi:Acyl-CoA dehydrogenase [Polaromonas sp. CG9_12]|nr:Acyl-CoA dehydrogenase [Polaromonas sp. CG9_12]
MNARKLLSVPDSASHHATPCVRNQASPLTGFNGFKHNAVLREILSQAHLTRLDFAVGSAGLMCQSLTLALNHAGTRRGFGRTLIEQPIRNPVMPRRQRFH